jgi:MFS family permease
MAVLCLASMVVLVLAFGLGLAPAPQFALIAVGGFLATCTVGPVSAIVIDVIHPGVRATGSSVLALFQNLFGLAAGPFIAGVLSDAWGIVPALVTTPLFAIVAAAAFLLASRSYAGDKARAAEPIDPAGATARPALA